MQEEIYTRHPFLAVIYLATAGVLIAALLLLVAGGYIDGEPLVSLTAWGSGLIALIALVAAYTYVLSDIKLRASGILVTNYQTPFSSTAGDADWNAVQSCTVEEHGIFAKAFNFGTVFIQTADAIPNLRLTYVANAQEVADRIDQQATLGGPAGA